MSLEIYSKDPYFSYKKRKRFDRAFYSLIVLLGLVAIFTALWPAFVWQFKVMPRLTSRVEDFPIPERQVILPKSLTPANIQVVKSPDGFSYFVPVNLSRNGTKGKNTPGKFFISIPKLRINDALVRVDSLDFAQNLSHFPGSALPGEVGNAFITGHSVLPQFANPKNYKAIFTELVDLEVGDKIYVDIEGKKLIYVVQYSKIVDPHNLSVLSPISQNGKNLTLMTCVPPGANTKRLVVITSLI